ncbi:MAG: CoA transferase [Acidiferrobacterales bacterium]|nr:CoA transferase [Acidiferrobacterales bacterium]
MFTIVATSSCAPVNTIDQVFANPQVKHRRMQIAMPHPATATDVSLIGNPIKLSATPVTYRHPPPMLGHDTDVVLHELLKLPQTEIERLRERGVI